MNKPSKLPTVEQAIEELDERRTRNIAQRINAAMAEVDYIQKEKKSGMNYSIVSHDAVTAKVRPILQAHGVVYYPRDFQVCQNGNRTELVFTVRFENIDDRSDYIDVATMGFGVDQQDKGPGKAISYGVKYALLKVLGLETGDDPDEVQDTRANHHPSQGEAVNGAHKDDPFPQGPAKNKTSLKDMGRAFWRDVEACGDSDELECLLADKNNQKLVGQIMLALPSWWDGGSDKNGEAFEGLEAVIARKRREFEQENV
jgi:hypothetical protein